MPEKKKQTGLPSWILIAAAAVIVVVAIAIGADFISKAQPAPVPTTVSSAGIVRSGRTEGDPNAPLTLVEFSDFQ